jgi:hypothetical protein
MLFDFILVLNIQRKHPTKNEYFCMHILFTTIYLLYKQKLNHENYSALELNMGNFVQANEYDVGMYAEFQDVCKYRYFYTNLTLFCLFSIYIIYCYETKLIFTGLWKATNYGDFLDLRDVMGGGRGGGNISKI